ncbi:hypothetical protein LTR22_026746 [Elasticomyces elasticus]|nr:hypothetical protein LTR22_026746 [Elasticomyces elasticus]KAK4910371.1 hypothetical protein LTR49_020978 [Elasticomyces elasticus]KAK5740851.1 hypothetical protein LTS12_024800 [Elasticomyces elasticus]
MSTGDDVVEYGIDGAWMVHICIVETKNEYIDYEPDPQDPVFKHGGKHRCAGFSWFWSLLLGISLGFAMKEIIEDDEYPRYQDTIIDDDDDEDPSSLGPRLEHYYSDARLSRSPRSMDLLKLLRGESVGFMEIMRREIEDEWPAFETGMPEDYFPVIEEEGVVFVDAPLPELVDEEQRAGADKASAQDPGHWERDD